MKHGVKEVSVVDPKFIDVLSGGVIFVGKGSLQNLLGLIFLHLASEAAPELDTLLHLGDYQKPDEFSFPVVLGWLVDETASFKNFLKFVEVRLPVQIQ